MQRRDSLTIARLVAAGVFTAEVIVLAVSGIWLIFFYAPSQAQAWQGLPHLNASAGVAGFVRGVHRVTAVLAALSALVVGALVVVDSRVRRAGWRQGRLG
ncbi:MAG: hypothetical protein M3011_04130, partial [Actinomycetota bacterium]|nr:hypothetical protein [Actinomycetota bacterium]